MPDYRVIPPPPIGGLTWQGGTAYNQGLGNAPATDFAAITEGLFTGLDKGSIIDARIQQTARENDPDKLADENLRRDLLNKISQQALDEANRKYGIDLKYDEIKTVADIEGKIAGTKGTKAGTRKTNIETQLLEEFGAEEYESKIARNYRVSEDGGDPELRDIQRQNSRIAALRALEKGEDAEEDALGAAPTPFGDDNAVLPAPQGNVGGGIKAQSPDEFAPLRQKVLEGALSDAGSTVRRDATEKSANFRRQSFQKNTESDRYQGEMEQMEVAETLLQQAKGIRENPNPLDPEDDMENLLTSMAEINQVYKNTKNPAYTQIYKPAIADALKTVGPERIQEYINSKRGKEKDNAEEIYARAAAYSGDEDLLSPDQQINAKAKLPSKYIEQPKLADDDFQTLISVGPIGVEDPLYKSAMRMSEYVIGARVASRNGTQPYTVQADRIAAGGDGADISGQGQSIPVIQFKGADGAPETIRNVAPPTTPEQEAQLAIAERNAPILQNRLTQKQQTAQQIGQVQQRSAQVSQVGAGPKPTPQKETKLKDFLGAPVYVNDYLKLVVPESGTPTDPGVQFDAAFRRYGKEGVSKKLDHLDKRRKPIVDAVEKKTARLETEKTKQDSVERFINIVESKGLEGLIGREGFIDKKVAALQEYSDLFATKGSQDIVNVVDGIGRLRGEALLAFLSQGNVSTVANTGLEQKTIMDAIFSENTEWQNLINYNMVERGKILQDEDKSNFQLALAGDIEYNDPAAISRAMIEYERDPRSKALIFNEEKYEVLSADSKERRVRQGHEKDADFTQNPNYMPPFEWFKQYGKGGTYIAGSATARGGVTPANADAQPTGAPTPSPTPTGTPTPTATPFTQSDTARGRADFASLVGETADAQSRGRADFAALVGETANAQSRGRADFAALVGETAARPEADIVTAQTEDDADFFVSPAEAQAVSAGSAEPRPTPGSQAAAVAQQRMDAPTPEPTPAKSFAEERGIKFESPAAEKSYNDLVQKEIAKGRGANMVSWLADVVSFGFAENMDRRMLEIDRKMKFPHAAALTDADINKIAMAKQEARQRFGEGSGTVKALKTFTEFDAQLIAGLMGTGGLQFLGKAASKVPAVAKTMETASKIPYVAQAAKYTPGITAQSLIDGAQNMAAVESEDQWKEFLTGGGMSAAAQIILGPGVKAGSYLWQLGKRLTGNAEDSVVAAKFFAENGQARQEYADSIARVKADPDLDIRGELPEQAKSVIQSAAKNPETAAIVDSTDAARQAERAARTAAAENTAGLSTVRSQGDLQADFTKRVSDIEQNQIQQLTAAEQVRIAGEGALQQAEKQQAVKQIYTTFENILNPQLTDTAAKVNKELELLNSLDGGQAVFDATAKTTGDTVLDLRSRASVLEAAKETLVGKKTTALQKGVQGAYNATRQELDKLPINSDDVAELNASVIFSNKYPLAEMLAKKNGKALADKGVLPADVDVGLLGETMGLAPTFKSLDEMRQLVSKYRGGPAGNQANEIIGKIDDVLNAQFERYGYPTSYTEYIKREGAGRMFASVAGAQAKVYNQIADRLDKSTPGSIRDFFINDYKKMQGIFGKDGAATLRNQLQSVDDALDVLKKADVGGTITDVSKLVKGIETSSKLLGSKNADFFAAKLIKQGATVVNRVVSELGPAVRRDIADGSMRVLKTNMDNAINNIDSARLAGTAGRPLQAKELFGFSKKAEFDTAMSMLTPTQRNLIGTFVDKKGNIDRTAFLFDVARDANTGVTGVTSRATSSLFRSGYRAVLDIATAVFTKQASALEQRQIVNAFASRNPQQALQLAEDILMKMTTVTGKQGERTVAESGTMSLLDAQKRAANWYKAFGITKTQGNVEDKRFDAPKYQAASQRRQATLDFLNRR